MVSYRRSRVAGGTYFFTVTLRNRQVSTLVERIDELRLVVKRAREEHPFRIDAFVVLPEHLHTVWTLPADDGDYAGRWRQIKGRFTRTLVKGGVALSKNSKGEYNLWQRRYWEHRIRDEEDFRRHIEYIHFNPVKHGLVKRVRDWPYSTFHKFVRQGVYPLDWAGSELDGEGEYGE
ncbi:MAG: transposase [Candidatus Thiodiazotropha sp. 6PLUC2]